MQEAATLTQNWGTKGRGWIYSKWEASEEGPWDLKLSPPDLVSELEQEDHEHGPNLLRRCWHLGERCKKVGSARVIITNWLQQLLQEGSASARVKRCCWGDTGKGSTWQKEADRTGRSTAASAFSCVVSPPSVSCLQTPTRSIKSNRNVVQRPSRNITELWKDGSSADQQ